MRFFSAKRRVQLMTLLLVLQFFVIFRPHFQPDLPPPIPRDDRVLTVVHAGGLGNLMFQLASAYGIALHNHMSLTLSSFDSRTSVLRSIFDQLKQIPDSPDERSLLRVKFGRWGWFDRSAFNLSTQQSVLLDGYLQSYKYFDEYSCHIRKMLAFKQDIVDEARRIVEKLTANQRNRTTVGIHVRRGDYLTEPLQKFGFIVPGADYFQRAMQYFRNKYRNVLFVVISEDIDWCRDNINGDDVVYGSTDYPAIHMCALSMLDHMIVSVGTFGWWAAYFNRGEKVYFRHLAQKDSGYAYGFYPDDFFPKEWLPL